MAVNKDKKTGKYYVSFYYKNSEGKLIRKKKKDLKKELKQLNLWSNF